ncbi:GNAT family N-acetyltransferase [Candidatus Viadribacter manganicus]|uniref:GNAT family acetyltransferase n=1 Tax=Candidatus Viadribacter manganicus TaxID=1759059 RepID=A0A1B1AEG7_9PROT|nr:GNAT family N-acetyltransferase [Candidatus Viadribacter manganicus]ANP44947.1 GNAT family acetyltransferase [Candidatus Viadribacter manganicus]
MIIREARATDRTQWDDLWAGYLTFYESSLAPEVTDSTWRRLLDPNEPMQALVAEDETGALLGFTHVVFHRGTWSIGDFCYLEDLFVAPNARKHGVARALIEAVYALADQRGAARVYWLTHESNLTARKLYDQVAQNRGFIQYRR